MFEGWLGMLKIYIRKLTKFQTNNFIEKFRFVKGSMFGFEG